MQALKFLLPQPPFEQSTEKQNAFDQLIDSTPPGSWIDYQLAYPKWQFLSYLCSTRNLVLHGTQNQDIAVVEPRKVIDIKAFSGQEAIYATTDGIWVIFFATVDRVNFGGLSLFNSCLEIQIAPGMRMGPFYFFSITHSVLMQKPWYEGAVYLLPRAGFQQEPAQQMMGAELIFPHWINAKPANPVAKLIVQPQDFPFLAEVHGHDDEMLNALAQADPDGFPWPAALKT